MIPGTWYVLCTRYVCTWYQPAEIYTYVRYVPPVDAHVWRQLYLSAVARCSDSYCIFARSKKENLCACSTNLCVCSTNLGFSGGSANHYCCTYYVPDTYVPHFMIPGTYYVPDTYDTRYVLCTRYVCPTLAVVLLIVQLYRYLFIRQWVVVRMIPTFRARNSCIAICLFVSARTFRPWTHTSDESYIYQLSLVVATATVSYIYDMVVDTQFHKFYGRPFARSIFIPHERYR